MIITKGKEHYHISLKDIWLYKSGTYRASFQVKCKQEILPIQLNPKNQFARSKDGSYTLKSWQQSDEQIEHLKLEGITIDIDIDRGNNFFLMCICKTFTPSPMSPSQIAFWWLFY